jgi:hypothetical protein
MISEQCHFDFRWGYGYNDCITVMSNATILGGSQHVVGVTDLPQLHFTFAWVLRPRPGRPAAVATHKKNFSLLFAHVYNNSSQLPVLNTRLI